jgi:hypothetical protein
MCKNASASIAALMAAIEPTLINLLTLLGIASTPEGQAAINAYNVALQAVENWKPGTSAQDVIQVINAFTQVFNTLPIPVEAKSLADIISAGIVVIIGILTGNATTDSNLQAKAASDAIVKVKVLIPGFKESLWDRARADLGDHTIAAKEYKNAWNKGVQTASKVNPKYAVLKQS